MILPPCLRRREDFGRHPQHECFGGWKLTVKKLTVTSRLVDDGHGPHLTCRTDLVRQLVFIIYTLSCVTIPSTRELFSCHCRNCLIQIYESVLNALQDLITHRQEGIFVPCVLGHLRRPEKRTRPADLHVSVKIDFHSFTPIMPPPESAEPETPQRSSPCRSLHRPCWRRSEQPETGTCFRGSPRNRHPSSPSKS